MIKSFIALIALLSFCGLGFAATPPPAANSPSTGQSAAQAKASQAANADETTSHQAAGKTPQSGGAPAVNDVPRAAFKQDVRVFVPKQSIDVDKAVDFPTNI